MSNAFASWPLEQLNSATKYPSIETYHPLGDKGRLQPEPMAWDGPAIVTEKIDGTNARIVCLGGGFLIGSRNDWLHAGGDLIHNPAERIVETIRSIADVAARWVDPTFLTVFYGEVYGAQIGKAGREYANTERGFRLFDAWSMSADAARKLLQASREDLARWRDNDGQPFMGEDRLSRIAEGILCHLVPRRATLDGANLPRDPISAFTWLSAEHDPWTHTLAALDGAAGKAEGVVIRSPDRKQISKLRFEDYARSLRR